MDPTESLSTVLYICTFIITLSSAATVIVSWLSKVKAPETKQNERIAALEEDVKMIKQHLDNDNKRLGSIEKGNKITQQALLAIMSHELNGNDIEQLTKAKENLEKYLIEK